MKAVKEKKIADLPGRRGALYQNAPVPAWAG